MVLGNPIPGETPIDGVSGLKIKGITARSELNTFEAANVSKAVTKYLAGKPSRRSARFDYAWSLRLHREMFGQVWAWAGKLRTSDKNIGVPWHQVETSLYGLLADLAYWKEHNTCDLAEQAVRLHHRAVQIHPFENGNGRWARLLANIWLKLHGRPITFWPDAAVGETSPVRAEYLEAIRQADRGEYEPLRELHRRFASS